MTKKEERTERAVKFGYTAFENSFNCGQSSLAGLLNEFMPDNPHKDELVKSASLVYGVGGRGETCGAVQGSMLFLGILYGEDTTTTSLVPTEAMKFMKKVSIISDFANAFKEKMGSTQCNEVHTGVMGKQYDMQRFQDLMAFYNDGADKKCQIVVETGIRIVCDLIMDDNGEIKSR